MKKFKNLFHNAKTHTRATLTRMAMGAEYGKAKAEAILRGDAGDFYISDAVKIIIAVVLGALLLLALTTLFNNTVIPRLTREIEGLFGS